MASTGGSGTIRNPHCPGPGPIRRGRPPHRKMTPSRPLDLTSDFLDDRRKDCCISENMTSHHKCTTKILIGIRSMTSNLTLSIGSYPHWFLVASILLVLLTGSTTHAVCTPCPAGCACTTLVSGSGCRVDCSNVASVDLNSLSFSALPADTVAELLLASCSITSVPSSAFNSFTILVKLDLSGNQITSLDPSVFQALTNLEFLSLQGNSISNLPQNIFAGRRKLRELNLSQNSLGHLAANIFSDLETLQVLRLSNNALTHLPIEVFERGKSLSQIDLSGNPWVCDCSLAAIISWSRQSSRQLLNPSATTCSDPAQHSGAAWASLNPALLPCDPSALVGCYHNSQSGVSIPVYPEESIPAKVSHAIECDRECAARGRPFGIYHPDGVCLCGESAPSGSCSCGHIIIEYGALLCQKTFITGAFTTHFGLLLGQTLPTSRLGNAQFSFGGASTSYDVHFDWGDGSDSFTHDSMTSSAVEHSYLLPGVYNVSLEVNGVDMPLKWPVFVQDPVGYAKLDAPRFSDAKKNLDLRLQLYEGTNATVRWSRFDADNTQMFGKTCTFGWYQHYVHTCIRPTVVPSTINYTEADRLCKEESGKLLYFNNANDMNNMITLLSSELSKGSVLLIGAQRTDNVTYVWMRNNAVTHFNSSVVRNSDIGECVAMDASGLIGLQCSSVSAYACRKGQVTCKHGGSEWQSRTCYVPLGVDAPLSQSEADTACRTISGRLATVDSQAKDTFLRQNVGNGFSLSYVWLGLNDHYVNGYWTWPNGASLGSFAPWEPKSPVVSTPGADQCVAMGIGSSSTSWKSVACSEKLAYICEYPNEEQVEQVQNFLSGTAKFTVDDTTVSTLRETAENVTSKTDLLLMPGHWIQHAGRVSLFRFATTSLPPSGTTKINFQVYRPICDSGLYLVPAGCSSQPSPFASCTTSPTSCTRSFTNCPSGKQYCPLIDQCLSVYNPCSCTALDPDDTIGCNQYQYTSHTQLTSGSLGADSYRFNGIMPKYSLVGQTMVTLNPNDIGTFNVKASGIDVQPDDVLGLQFVTGDYQTLCETVTEDMDTANWGQSMLSFQVLADASLELVNANGAVWLDSMVCNLHAIYTKPTEVPSPDNLINKGVHSVGDYTYRATVYSDISPEQAVFETVVTMQNSVSNIKLATPEPKWPKRTADAWKSAVVEAHTSEDFLWYIKQGTDPLANWTMSDGNPAFTASCPSSLNSHISECSKNYQYLHYRWDAGAPGSVTPVTVHGWNMVSEKSLTIDVLAQERIASFSITSLPITEFIAGTSTKLYSSMTAGSDVSYEWDFGDGRVVKSSKANETNFYAQPGIYTIKAEASNYLESQKAQASLKLVRRANVQNLRIIADAEVDMLSDFTIQVTCSVTVQSSVTVYIDLGDGSSHTYSQTQIENTNTIDVKKTHRYSLGNVYNITVYVVDNLDWDGLVGIPTLYGQGHVKTLIHSLQAWTIITGLTISSTPNCHATNTEITFNAGFPDGVSPSSYTFSWDYGDQSPASASNKHSYNSPHTYTVTLNIRNPTSKGTATYKKCIQTPISGLTLTAKSSPLPLTRGQSTATKFNTGVQGSNLQYAWSYNGRSSNLAPDSFTAVFTSHGTHSVKLNVSNSISYRVKTTDVVVQEVISGLKITHNGPNSHFFKTNDLYNFQSAITTGSDYNIEWSIARPAPAQPLMLITKDIQTSWSAHNTYTVKVVYKNLVGQQTSTLTVIVQTPVTSVSLTAPDNSQANNEITITAAPQGGVEESSMKYEWTLCRDQEPCVSFNQKTQSLITTPTESGSHVYSVRAYNDISSTSTSKTIEVWDKLDGLSIDIDDQYIINDWAIKGKPLTFGALLQTGKADYSFRITGGSFEKTSDQTPFVVTLDDEIQYTLVLTATNVIESISATYLFRVQEAVEDVVIHPILGDIAYINETLDFKVTHRTGSYPKYIWQLTKPDNSVIPLAGRLDVTRHFDVKGDYTITVDVSNKVTDVTQTLKVEIRDPVTAYNIISDYASDPYVHQNIPINCNVKDSAGNVIGNTGNLQVLWSIYDRYPPAKGSLPTINHNFTVQDNFTVEARLVGGNQLIVIRKTVHVQGKLPPVTLTQDKTLIASGESVRFEATVHNWDVALNPLQYWWIIGNEIIESSDKVFVKKFDQPGVVRIQVLARNKVSFSEDHVMVTVQDCIEDIELEDCCFYNTSENIKLKANVTKGTNVTYTWSISTMSLTRSVGNTVDVVFPGKQSSSVGDYIITINATNLVCTAKKSFPIKVQDAIKGLDFEYAPTEVYVGQSVTFQAGITSGTDVLYKWEFFNISLSDQEIDKQQGPSNQFQKNFTNQGSIYVLSVTAYNNVSRVNKWQFINSFVIRCDPMKLTAIGGTTRVELRSRWIDLDVVVDANCTRYPIMYNWMVYKNCDKNAEVDIGNVTQPQLILQPRSLDYGKYCIKLRSRYEGTPVIIDLDFDITVQPTYLIPIIYGGNARIVSTQREVTLSALPSYDPDIGLQESDEGLNYEWTFSSTCSVNALGRPRDAEVTFPPNTLTPDCSYAARLQISKPGRNPVSTTQTIVTRLVDVPLVEIICLSCGATDQHSFFGNAFTTKLQGACANCPAGSSTVAYAWTVTRNDSQVLALTADVSTTGSNKANIAIRAGSLSTKHSYTFRLEVTDTQTFTVKGYAEITMRPNQPPSAGSCHVLNANNTVIVSDQNLEIACYNWTDPDDTTTTLLNYQVHIESQNSLEKYLVYSGSKSAGSFPISTISGLKQEVVVVVTIADKWGSKVLGLSQSVQLIVQANGEDLLKKLDQGFPVLVMQQTPKELLQFAIALTKQLNSVFSKLGADSVDLGGSDGSAGGSDGSSSSVSPGSSGSSASSGSSSDTQVAWVSYRAKIIKALPKMNFAETLEDMQQLAYLLKHLTNNELGFDQDSATCEALLQLVDNMMSWMDNQITVATNSEDISPDYILDLINNVINGLKLPSMSNTTSNDSWKNGITEKLVEKITSVLASFSRSTIPGELPFEYDTAGMTAVGHQVLSSSIQTEYNFNGCIVRLPPDLLTHLGLESSAVFQSVMVMDSNPLQGQKKISNTVTSKCLGIHFKYSNNNTDIPIVGLDEKHRVEMIMSRSTSTDSTQSGNRSAIFEPNEAFKTSFNSSSFAYGGLNIEIIGEVIPNENETFNEVAEQLRLTAYIGYGFEPYWYLYNKSLTITINSTTHTNYTFFTTIDKDTPSFIYVSVHNECFDSKHQVNVSVATYEVQCQYYSYDDSLWTTNGCYPTAASNRSHTHCDCNHLSLFGASSIVTPGDIDFSDLGRLDLADNPVVVILVAVIAGVFIVLVFWARQYDLQDLHNISIVPLCGRDGYYKYEVVILTGQRRGAGTSAHVGIKLYGDESKSGARHLHRLGAFQRNSEDNFLIATPVPLGNLHKIHLWHDNTGKHPSWYVKRVVVRDLNTNKKTFFLVDTWLSLTMEKGTIDKQIYAASATDLTNFGTVFQSETSRGFAERHVWLSVWDRPPRSRFTRVQRVVCCITILYSFMCANVMWYGLINNPKRVTQALGLVSIGWQDFVVGILASLVVFPINFLIIQIFRFTKVKVNAMDYGIKPGTAQTIEVEAMCDMSQAGDSFIAYERKNSVVPLHRESSSDSIMVTGKAIFPSPCIKDPSKSQRNGGRSTPQNNVKIHAPSSTKSRQEDAKQVIHVPIESRKWWSYDTILKWPEKMPNDVRPESGMALAGPLRKRSAFRSINTKDIDNEDSFIIDDDTLRLHGCPRTPPEYNNNKPRIPITTTSGTLSISQSIAEIEEDMASEENKPECSKKYQECIPMTTLQVPQPATSGGGSSGYGTGERTDSWCTNSSGAITVKEGENKSGNVTTTGTSKQQAEDGGSLNKALMEIDNVIKESNEIEPRLLNRKKSSMNQGNVPHVDILRLDEFDPEGMMKEAMDEDLSDLAHLEPKHGLRKTKSKIRVSKRWAQIVIPQEYETYRDRDFKIFDPEDEYDAVSITRSSLNLKSRGSTVSSTTTNSSRYHQLMPTAATNARWLLPHWAVYIAYSLCFIVSGMSVIVTILYGHSFGRELALKWLLAFFISFLDSVFILEPLKVLALAVFVAMLTRGLQDGEDGIETRPVIESNEKLKDVRMKPIGGFALLQAREEGHRVQRMHRLLRHFCVYFLFVWVAFFITYRAHNTSIFPTSHDVLNTLIVPKTGTGLAWHDIAKSADYWSWIQEVAAPALYPKINDTSNTQRLLLGEVRLRQIRSYQVQCHVSGPLVGMSADYLLTHGCYGNPDWKEDKASFEPGWRVMSPNSTWSHTPDYRALGAGYEGVVGSYGGGGYIQTLGPTLQDSQNKLAQLFQSNWTDRGTRAVFMEANLYTIPFHLHTTVRIVAEFPVSGGVWMSQEVQSFHMENHVAGRVTAIMIFMVLTLFTFSELTYIITALLSIIWLYLLFVVLMGFRRHTWRYLFEFWHVMEFTVMIVTLAVIACFIHRVVTDTATHERYLDQPKSFNSYFYSMDVWRTWKAFSAILVFILTAWMVRALRFIKAFSAYGQTIRVAAPKLVGAVVILVIVLFSFSSLGHLWYGSLISSFRTFGSSFVTVFGLVRARTVMALGTMHTLNPAVAGLFLFGFIATVMTLVMGLFIAVLNSTYRMVRLQTYYKNTIEMPDYEMVEFMMKRFKRYIGITKPKPAFRRVKFQGMPSLSSRSSMSSRTGMSQSLVSTASNDPFGLDALHDETYLEDLLDRAVPTWTRMLEKLERVLWLDREITRLETALIEALAKMLLMKKGLGKMPLIPRKLLEMKRAVARGKIFGPKGGRCHRSNSESLMTDVRAKQIREALNAELHEMEEKIIADTEKPASSSDKWQRPPKMPGKSNSFTVIGEAHELDSLAEYEMEILGDTQTKEGSQGTHQSDVQADSAAGYLYHNGPSNGGSSRHPPTSSNQYHSQQQAVPGKPPIQPRKFLNSAGPRRTYHEAGSTATSQRKDTALGRTGTGGRPESPSPAGSGSRRPTSRHRPASPHMVRPGTGEVRDAPMEAQKAYCSKLPRREVKIPGVLPKPNFTRRPTSEQSERVKKHPDLPLPKADPST